MELGEARQEVRQGSVVGSNSVATTRPEGLSPFVLPPATTIGGVVALASSAMSLGLLCAFLGFSVGQGLGGGDGRGLGLGLPQSPAISSSVVLASQRSSSVPSWFSEGRPATKSEAAAITRRPEQEQAVAVRRVSLTVSEQAARQQLRVEADRIQLRRVEAENSEAGMRSKLMAYERKLDEGQVLGYLAT